MAPVDASPTLSEMPACKGSPCRDTYTSSVCSTDGSQGSGTDAQGSGTDAQGSGTDFEAFKLHDSVFEDLPNEPTHAARMPGRAEVVDRTATRKECDCVQVLPAEKVKRKFTPLLRKRLEEARKRDPDIDSSDDDIAANKARLRSQEAMNFMCLQKDAPMVITEQETRSSPSYDGDDDGDNDEDDNDDFGEATESTFADRTTLGLVGGVAGGACFALAGGALLGVGWGVMAAASAVPVTLGGISGTAVGARRESDSAAFFGGALAGFAGPSATALFLGGEYAVEAGTDKSQEQAVEAGFDKSGVAESTAKEVNLSYEDQWLAECSGYDGDRE